MADTEQLPRTSMPDSTLGLWRDGYTFIGKRCARLGSDAFRTRLLFEDVVCMTGVEAAEMFYAGGRFSRHRAMPVSVLKLLQDRNSVQFLEDSAHRRRKALFLSLLAPEEIARLTTEFADTWSRKSEVWKHQPEVVLYKEVFDALTEAACAWAGLPVDDRQARRRSAEFFAMIDGAGAVGPRNWRALYLRRRAERWVGGRVREARAQGRHGLKSDPLHRLADYRGEDDAPLLVETVAVELLNLLRPIAATAHFIVFAALHLHERPHWREAFARGEEQDLESFVQEVRRLSPFFPLIGGRARAVVNWRGLRLPRGQWVLLDLYGTCRDPRLWERAEEFRPERFRGCKIDPFTLIPQGAGHTRTGHRCPGEGVVIELMKESLRILTQRMSYDVPPQDLSVDITRMPALSRSGFIMANPRPVQEGVNHD